MIWKVKVYVPFRSPLLPQCHFPGKGEFFSRGLQNSLTGTTQWVTMETPFFLKKGETPDYVRLNLVINGKGTAWIDEIRLLRGLPLS